MSSEAQGAAQNRKVNEADETSDWRTRIAAANRHANVAAIIKALFPSTDLNAANSPKLYEMMCYARELEIETFDKSNDLEHYNNTIAEKVIELRTEVEEKRAERERAQNPE